MRIWHHVRHHAGTGLFKGSAHVFALLLLVTVFWYDSHYIKQAFKLNENLIEMVTGLLPYWWGSKVELFLLFFNAEKFFFIEEVVGIVKLLMLAFHYGVIRPIRRLLWRQTSVIAVEPETEVEIEPETQTQTQTQTLNLEGVRAMRPLISFLAGAACFLIAVVATAVFIYGVDHLTLGTVTIPLIKSGLVFGTAYVALNILSWAVGQDGDDPLYWFDYVSSWIAWLFINVAALYVAIAMSQSYEGITKVTEVPFAFWLLGSLVLFSWIDVFGLQGKKLSPAWQQAQAQQQNQPAPQQNNPGPQQQPQVVVRGSSLGGIMATIAVVILGTILLLMLFGGDGISTFAASGKGSDACSAKFIGKTDKGADFYQLNFDC